ncbi:VOC family protein [Aureimonas phyllosphaerae]|uniref:Catechol 2,3-dioxygenase-like lactoylglutathione lyase family enzyme n=1 Tax=Aureimonas phyllosphaerae TaxID=1166078 RepID=A0A7W6BR64_9HYPH|nr:VOC family protein [Aureimonas phyllosphaerae]MBB3936561.1 catechol 2,3-dioxygenase-like lactoylglutathione lyase family enzyme [Aureimonas phyllosphaerae]MBB3960575.1 catechol 2,3-dioxygenase-like lactoylglutathione lyase family enzyme [Aureimonas phyllosphaerae]SFF57924.1 Catechol-2,3-dioxygenase [Aureimonas phyllosphaerae]
MSDQRIVAVRLACRDVEATARFYGAAFGCREAAGEKGMRVLLLGHQRLELVQATQDGEPAPPSNAVSFQHCAIVVPDMDKAMRYLRGVSGWTAILLDGAESLPEASGGATAFKFRDPDGHPLELIEFHPGKAPAPWRHRDPIPFLGIDHSAVTVSDTDRAVAFWRELGFAVQERHTNRGPEQARMDGLRIPEAVVEVTTLKPSGGGPPHLELLRYATPAPALVGAADGSPFATSLVLQNVPAGSRSDADPDGHRFRHRGA